MDEVYEEQEGTYVCDYTESVNTSSRTVRAVVQVTTIGKGDFHIKIWDLKPHYPIKVNSFGLVMLSFFEKNKKKKPKK